jgi:hypothetical protein
MATYRNDYAHSIDIEALGLSNIAAGAEFTVPDGVTVNFAGQAITLVEDGSGGEGGDPGGGGGDPVIEVEAIDDNGGDLE